MLSEKFVLSNRLGGHERQAPRCQMTAKGELGQRVYLYMCEVRFLDRERDVLCGNVEEMMK